ncbi:MAG: hypothetical protein CR974_02885 [Gammaproteobacteria bacterium]|nr:MAG: hypothetical protein CR974_02885 [Gammaproteobacteria bacterium]
MINSGTRCFIDIGNTRIKYALASRIQTPLVCQRDDLSALFSLFDDNRPAIFVTAGRSESAQQSLKQLRQAAEKRQLPCEIIRVRPDELAINYPDSTQFGVDRFLHLLAGKARQRASQQPFCVVSAGTAITLDFYTDRHLGGMILLGLGSARSALMEKTGLTALGKPAGLLGHDTATSIGAGLFIGYQNLIVSSIARVADSENAAFYTYWTGGDAEALFSADIAGEIVPALLFEGMLAYCP